MPTRLSRLIAWLHARRTPLAGFAAGAFGAIALMLFASAIVQGGLSDSAPPAPQAIFIELE